MRKYGIQYSYFLQNVVIICNTPVDNQNSDVIYWKSEMKMFCPDVPVILADKQVGPQTLTTSLAQEIGADMYIKYLGDNSDGSVDKVFETAVRVYFMKIGMKMLHDLIIYQYKKLPHLHFDEISLL